MASYIKDPSAILDYGFNWHDWLTGDEVIIESSWTVDSGLTKVSDGFTVEITSVWLSGGTVGSDYNVVNHIRTSQNREDERTLIIKVRNR